MATTSSPNPTAVYVNAIDPFSLSLASADVLSFIDSHKLGGQIESALTLAKQIFPANTRPSICLEQDAETTGEWIVIDMTMRSDVGEALKAYHQFVRQWSSLSPPGIGNFVRITFNLL